MINYEKKWVDATGQITQLRAALRWALDVLELNDKFITKELGVECDQRINQTAVAKAQKVLNSTTQGK